MLIWETKIPAFLVSKPTIVRTMFFTGLIALAFINIYAPFEAHELISPNEITLFLYSSLVVLTGMLVIIISRIIMYWTTKRTSLNYLQYFIWVIIEVLSMASFFALYVKFAIHDPRTFLEIMKVSIKNTALILLLPYSLLWLYFSWREKTQQLEKLAHQETPPEQHADKMIPFYDEKGTLRFSVKLDDLIYLEAADNYVNIFYSANNKVSKYMIRNTLKKLEEKLQSSGIIRCHRSYLVNFKKVKILMREKEGLFLELNAEKELTLPVSKTYVQPIIESFSDMAP